ncbi:MAG TPA: arylsulfatase [Candidatus Hydrogenedentes bacterium]|nr:arylsulfatase [Candidatus Hydrogenedentota bacterium]
MRRSRRDFLRAAGLAGLALAGARGGAAAGARIPPRPNIVFVMADDLGYGDPRCMNAASKIPTPHMDRLAREGVRFTDAHTPSAVCTPTRYGVLTGRYCWRSRLTRGVLEGYDRALIEPGRVTVASLLREHGYHTACIGKWHLGLGAENPTDYTKPLRPGPREAGFDEFYGIAASLDMPPYCFIENDRPAAAPTEHIAKSERPAFWREGAIAPGFTHEAVLPVLTGKAVAYIERRAQEPAPFFLYFPLTAPHTPWVPVDTVHGRSQAGDYGDFVAQVDDALGQVLDALARTGCAEQTLVIFTSDNGSHWTPAFLEEWGHRANGAWRGQKADIWDGGHRVPFLARWPGVTPPDTACSEIICLTDLLATCAAIVGAGLPENAGEDSFNLLPALRGQPGGTPIREATVHHAYDGSFAIRQGRWKLIQGLGSGGFSAPRAIDPIEGGPRGQLYDLDADPGESVNLWAEHPDVVVRLSALLDRYKRDGRSRPKRYDPV